MSSSAVVLEVDAVAEAAYVRFSESDVARTVAFNDEINIDLDAFGVVVGIEVLDLAAEIPFTALVTDFHVESQKVDLLRMLRRARRAPQRDPAAIVRCEHGQGSDECEYVGCPYMTMIERQHHGA